uniref:Uncharacterized protein n=1 Tax=Strongyloides papillosus TaxID=174720 RepID=A0A0N5BD54_STREA
MDSEWCSLNCQAFLDMNCTISQHAFSFPLGTLLQEIMRAAVYLLGLIALFCLLLAITFISAKIKNMDLFKSNNGEDEENQYFLQNIYGGSSSRSSNSRTSIPPNIGIASIPFDRIV